MCVVLCAEQDTLSEQVEAGATEHLAFEGFDAADVAFDRAAAVGQGEPVEDGGLVAADAAGEGVQVGQVVEGGGGDSGGGAGGGAAGSCVGARGVDGQGAAPDRACR